MILFSLIQQMKVLPDSLERILWIWEKKKGFVQFLAFWSLFSLQYCWHKWCMPLFWPDVITPQHLQLGALLYLSAGQSDRLWYFFAYLEDALLSDGTVCLWPSGRWKAATTDTTVLSRQQTQTHRHQRLKTLKEHLCHYFSFITNYNTLQLT